MNSRIYIKLQEKEVRNVFILLYSLGVVVGRVVGFKLFNAHIILHMYYLLALPMFQFQRQIFYPIIDF